MVQQQWHNQGEHGGRPLPIRKEKNVGYMYFTAYGYMTKRSKDKG